RRRTRPWRSSQHDLTEVVEADRTRAEHPAVEVPPVVAGLFRCSIADGQDLPLPHLVGDGLTPPAEISLDLRFSNVPWLECDLLHVVAGLLIPPGVPGVK